MVRRSSAPSLRAPVAALFSALSPALVLGVFVVSGGFASGASAVSAGLGQIVLLSLGAIGALRSPIQAQSVHHSSTDGASRLPFRRRRLGRRHAMSQGQPGSLPWRLLAVGLVCLLVSWVVSPVPRAGTVAVLLALPLAFAPWALAPAWRYPLALPGRSRRRAATHAVAPVSVAPVSVAPVSVAMVSVAAALWSLMGVWRFGDPVAAAPLGHHNLLALWLVATLPLAALASWPVALAALVTGGAALAWSGSLGGLVGAWVAVAVYGLGAWRARGSTGEAPWAGGSPGSSQPEAPIAQLRAGRCGSPLSRSPRPS